jgi:hypothetical protein
VKRIIAPPPIVVQQTAKSHFGAEKGGFQDLDLQYDKPSDPPVTEALQKILFSTVT